MSFEVSLETISVTEATARGLSAIVRSAGEGHEIVVARRGRAVAAVVGMDRLAELAELEDDLRSAALVLTRLAADEGQRSVLDEVISAFGLDRKELVVELDADLAAGRD